MRSKLIGACILGLALLVPTACGGSQVSPKEALAANQRGGTWPIPLLWPQSGFSNAPAGSIWTQMPGEINPIVSIVRHCATGSSC